MNIVYMLTNTSKTAGKRFYIGSKTECQVVPVDGVTTIIDREGKPYYSSSSSFEFKTEILQGDVFAASVLEEVYDKKNLLEVENSWIDRANAVYSEEYYNISNAVLNCHNQEAIANLFGESVKELAKNNSSASKRDNSAKDLGYGNFGELCFSIWERFSTNNNWQVVAESFGKERHWANVTVRPFDMGKAKEDLTRATSAQVRELVSKKCSLSKAAEILHIELPAARVLLGDFNKATQKVFSVAMMLGKTQGELEAEITKDVLAGIPWRKVTQKHGVNETSAKRYFMRCIRRHIDPSDISSEIHETEDELNSAKAKRRIKQQRMSNFKNGLKLVKEVPFAKNIQSNNKSGVNGVMTATRRGVLFWLAQWVDFIGKKRSKGFSTNVYGNDVAFKMACELRAKMEDEVMKLKEAA